MIGTLMVISEESYHFFNALEKAMKTVVSDCGGFSHDVWREFSNGRRSGKRRTTIDGDLIERFLELDKAKMEDIVMKLNDDTRSRLNMTTIDESQRISHAGFGDKANFVDFPKDIFTVEQVVLKVEDMSRLH